MPIHDDEECARVLARVELLSDAAEDTIVGDALNMLQDELDAYDARRLSSAIRAPVPYGRRKRKGKKRVCIAPSF